MAHCSTHHWKEKIVNKKDEEQETILVDENRRNEPVVIGYYPVISHQPVSLPSPIFLSNDQIYNSKFFIDHSKDIDLESRCCLTSKRNKSKSFLDENERANEQIVCCYFTTSHPSEGTRQESTRWVLMVENAARTHEYSGFLSTHLCYYVCKSERNEYDYEYSDRKTNDTQTTRHCLLHDTHNFLNDSDVEFSSFPLWKQKTFILNIEKFTNLQKNKQKLNFHDSWKTERCLSHPKENITEINKNIQKNKVKN